MLYASDSGTGIVSEVAWRIDDVANSIQKIQLLKSDLERIARHMSGLDKHDDCVRNRIMASCLLDMSPKFRPTYMSVSACVLLRPPCPD